MKYSNHDMQALSSAFNLWLTTPASPKGGEPVIAYLFQYAHMEPEEQEKERMRWLDTVETGHTMALADIDQEMADAKRTKEAELQKVRDLRAKLNAKKDGSPTPSVDERID